MLYPKMKCYRRGVKLQRRQYQWFSTRTGFRYGGTSFWRWLRYPFTRFAWQQHRTRKSTRD